MGTRTSRNTVTHAVNRQSFWAARRRSSLRAMVMAVSLVGSSAFLSGPVLGLASVVRAQSALAAQEAPAQVQAVARAFEAAVRTHDAAGMLVLFAPDGQIKEKHAVLAAGPERLLEWLQHCVATELALEPDSMSLTGNGVRWHFQDWTDCYERTRPNALATAWDVSPAVGTLELTVQAEKIAILTFTYSPEWERTRLMAQAAPIRTAQVQATARAQQDQAAAIATAAYWAEATRVAEALLPDSPETQERATPSVAPWAGALLLIVGITGFAAAQSKAEKP